MDAGWIKMHIIMMSKFNGGAVLEFAHEYA